MMPWLLRVALWIQTLPGLVLTGLAAVGVHMPACLATVGPVGLTVRRCAHGLRT